MSVCMNDHYLLFANVAYSLSILRPLQDAIRQREGKAAWFLHGLDASLLNDNEKLLRTVDEVKQFNPKAIFIPGNWVPDFFPGAKVEIFHGFGIEKKGHFDIRGFFDLYCTHGPLTTQPFNKLARKYGFFHVIETGWPKIDYLFQYKPEKAWKALNNIQKPVILYAPTFSPSLCSAIPLKETIGSLAINGRYHWLVKFHPLMDQDVINTYRQLEGKHLQVVEDPDIIPYLYAADVMLTDTSSVVTEFLLLDKPVVTFRTKLPAPHIVDIRKSDDLEPALNKILQHPDELMKEAKKFIKEMHPYMDGRSGHRVLNAVDDFIAHFAAKLKPKPLNLWRKLQVRQRLKYYHLK